MPRILVVEDSPERVKVFEKRLKGDVTFAADYATAVEALAGERFEEVWLDHDLADERHNGQDVAYHMTELPVVKRPRRVIVHSMNPPGALGIVQTLARAGFNVMAQPFHA